MANELEAVPEDPQDDPPRASFRQIRPEYQINGVTHVVYYSHATHLPSDVFAYGREAFQCFRERRYLATITLASAMVEVILNKDSRMLRPNGGWRTLTMKLIRDGKRKSLPVDRLLDSGESFTRLSIAFIELRNRLAHGNLTNVIGFEHHGTPDYSLAAQELAL